MEYMDKDVLKYLLDNQIWLVNEVVYDLNLDVKDIKVIYASPFFKELYVKLEENIINKSIKSVLPDLNVNWIDICINVLKYGNSYKSEYHCSKLDKYFKVDINSLEKGKISMIFTDITKYKAYFKDGNNFNIIDNFNCYKFYKKKLDESKVMLKKFAYFDMLTDLPNKSSLSKDLKILCSRHIDFVFIFIDIDNFKYINDILGHDYGDLLLKGVSKMLNYFSDINCKLYRWGGDEFAFVLLNKKNSKKVEIEKFLEDIKSSFENNQFIIHNNEINITASIGASLYPKDSLKSEELVKYADNAMYYVKENGKNGYKIYEKEIYIENFKKVKIERELRFAVKNNNFKVLYQPQIDIRTNKLIGMEALVRWIDVRNNIVAPIEFISVAEKTGLILSIGKFVLNRACKQIKKWNDKYNCNLKVAVNLSAKQFEDKNLIKIIKEAINNNNCYAENLELEITENIAMKNIDFTIYMLDELKEMGIKVALDDFGKGYSSLNYLKDMPIDIIKLDKSFIDKINVDKKVESINKSIIYLSHELNLKVLAEGVEKKEQLEFLRQNGCDEVQGYYFSKPLMPKSFENTFLKDNFNCNT